MRRMTVVAIAFCLLAGVSSAWAQHKVDAQWKCEAPSETHSLDAGDQPGHVYMLNKLKCVALKGSIAGDKETEGSGVETHDVYPAKTEWKGTFIDVLASGDRVFISYSGSGSVKDGVFTSGTNEWKIVGGTGKFVGATGSGSCKGTGAADGTSTWDCTGKVDTKK